MNWWEVFAAKELNNLGTLCDKNGIPLNIKKWNHIRFMKAVVQTIRIIFGVKLRLIYYS